MLRKYNPLMTIHIPCFAYCEGRKYLPFLSRLPGLLSRLFHILRNLPNQYKSYIMYPSIFVRVVASVVTKWLIPITDGCKFM